MSPKTDLLVLGATGFTGRLIIQYLSHHPQRNAFTFAIGARSSTKVKALLQELDLHQDPSIVFVQVDVNKKAEVENAVKNARVVINTVGPFWRWGTPVVGACAKAGVHYVDLASEVPFLRRIIYRYGYLASKTGSIIVPCCGYDSIPSDVCAYLSNKTLKTLPTPLDVGSSMTSHRLKGGVSGGTISSVITMLEVVPKKDLEDSLTDYSTSPVLGRKLPRWRFFYKVPVPGAHPLIGGFFFMEPTNKALVQRSFGLLELQARTSKSKEAQLARYGPDFAYDEFLAMTNTFAAVSYTLVYMTGLMLFFSLRPVRWLVQKFLPKPGEGPSEEAMQKGFMSATNITKSTSEPPVHVKTVMKGRGDPGYLLTAIMISEAALSLIFPPDSDKNCPEAARTALPLLARETGGVLTPMTAFGDVLIKRLEASGRFEFSSSVIGRDLKED